MRRFRILYQGPAPTQTCHAHSNSRTLTQPRALPPPSPSPSLAPGSTQIGRAVPFLAACPAFVYISQARRAEM